MLDPGPRTDGQRRDAELFRALNDVGFNIPASGMTY
jgi:hypothetical protein